MSKKTVLSKEQLIVSIPKEAVQCFQSALASHRSTIKKMMEGVEITLNQHMKKHGHVWETLSTTGKTKTLASVFEQVRVLMKVGDPSGDGMAAGTFNTHRTRINRCFLYHVDYIDSTWNGTALGHALAKALKMGDGPIKDRMKQALQECIQDKTWPGHPPICESGTTTANSPTTQQPIQAELAMPISGMASSTNDLLRRFLQVIVDRGSQDDIRKPLRDSDDPRYKKVRQIIMEANDLLRDFKEEEVSAA